MSLQHIMVMAVVDIITDMADTIIMDIAADITTMVIIIMEDIITTIITAYTTLTAAGYLHIGHMDIGIPLVGFAGKDLLKLEKATIVTV